MNPGEMRDRVQMLELVYSGTSYAWQPVKSVWAKAEETGKTNLFSKVGIGVQTVKFLLRKQSLTLHQAILWEGRHCFLTDIKEVGVMPRYLEVTAALITPTVCTLYRTTETIDGRNHPVYERETDCIFPGCLTEKYLGFREVEFHGETSTTLVVVSPKEIRAEPGQLCEIEGELYQLLLCHTLDEYKNEYEIRKAVDV